MADFFYHILGGYGVAVLEPVYYVYEHAADDHTCYGFRGCGNGESIGYTALKTRVRVLMILVYECLDEHRAHRRAENLGDSLLVLDEETYYCLHIIDVVVNAYNT